MNEHPPTTGRGLSFQTLFLIVAVIGACLVILYMGLFSDGIANGKAQAPVSRLRLRDIPFNGARAYEYLNQLCALGPRPSGSAGMDAQQRLLIEHFRKLGGQVELQKFRVRHPLDGSPVPMTNLIIHWFPERKTRIVLCAHYDTLPYPMLDPQNPHGTFVGANDGGSGVAVLMELAHDLPQMATAYGVDFLLLDGEEFIFQPNGRFFLGSEYFARRYVQQRPPYRYRWGVLLDMVGDAELQLYQERNSMWWSDTRPLVEDIWATAARLGVREFIPEKKHEIRDDHLALHDIARIPTCDIIDFDYPAWHTQGDTPDKCSALSLAKVGWVLREWLKAVPLDERRR
jgi:hypothetical protein